MIRYVATFRIRYQAMRDSLCDPPKEYTSVQYLDAHTIDAALEVARRFRRELKDDFTYSVTLDSLVEDVAFA